MIIGSAPVKLTVDASNVMTDFGTKENTIEWDTDEDGNYDIINNVQWTKNFINSRLHTISYQIPGISPYSYSFDLRVEQPDTPICVVDVIKQ